MLPLWLITSRSSLSDSWDLCALYHPDVCPSCVRLGTTSVIASHPWRFVLTTSFFKKMRSMATSTHGACLGHPSLIPQLPGSPTLAEPTVARSGNSALPVFPEVSEGGLVTARGRHRAGKEGNPCAPLPLTRCFRQAAWLNPLGNLLMEPSLP